MFRHVFLIPIKAGTSEELLQKKMQEMRDMKKQRRRLKQFMSIGRWAGLAAWTAFS